MTPDGYAVAATSDGVTIVTPDGTVTDLPAENPPTPIAVAAGAVLLSSNGGLVALDLRGFDVLWSSADGGGKSPVPALHRGVAFSLVGREVTAVSLDAGQLLWRHDVSRGRDSRNITASDDVVVVASGDELVGLDPRDGAVQWRVRRGDLDVADDGTIPEGDFGVPTAGPSIVAVATDTTLMGLDASSGDVAWHTGDRLAPRFGVAFDAMHLYYHGGGSPPKLTARRTGTGEVAWTRELPGGTLTSAPTMAGADVLVLALVTTSVTEVDGLEVPLHDTAVLTFDMSGTLTGERRLDHTGSWHVGTAGGYVAFAGEVGETPTSAGAWELVVVAPGED